MQTQGWQRYEDIVRFEARRAGEVFGLDREDVEQELRLVTARCAGLVEGNTGRAYVRQAVRYRLANMKREANACARRPRDARGRVLKLAQLEYTGADGEVVERALPAPEPALDERAEALRMMQRLRGLSARDQRILYRAFVDLARVDEVALERARRRAEAILTGAITRVERYAQETTMDESVLPTCHTDGEEKLGYETDPKSDTVEECRNCIYKVSCLLHGLQPGGPVKGIDLSADQEVKAVHHGLLTLEQVRERIGVRERLLKAEEEVPADMCFDDVGELQEKLDRLPNKVDVVAPSEDEEEAEPEIDTEEEPVEDEPEIEVEEPAAQAAKPKRPKAEKKPKAEPKAAAPKSVRPAAAAKPKAEKKAKAPKVKAEKPKKAKKLSKPVANRLGEKGSFKYPGSPRALKDGRIKLPSGRVVGAPMAISHEQMGKEIEKLNGKLGLSFDITPGMTLVQERRDGENFEVKITKTGFEWDGQMYPSLSRAAMARFRRQVSGIDVFSFQKQNNILIKGKGVPGGTFRRSSVEGQSAAAE